MLYKMLDLIFLEAIGKAIKSSCLKSLSRNYQKAHQNENDLSRISHKEKILGLAEVRIEKLKSKFSLRGKQIRD